MRIIDRINRVIYLLPSNGCFEPSLLLNCVIAVVNGLAIAFFVTRIGSLSTPWIQHKVVMITLTSIEGASFLYFGICALLKINEMKIDKKAAEIRADWSKLQQDLEKQTKMFLHQPAEAVDKVHPLSQLPDCLKGLICQYASLLEGHFLKQEFGLVSELPRETLLKNWQKRLGYANVEDSFKSLGLKLQPRDYYDFTPVIEDGLDHIENLLTRILHWERLHLKIKFKIMSIIRNSWVWDIPVDKIRVVLGLFFSSTTHETIVIDLNENEMGAIIDFIAKSNSLELITRALECFSVEDINKKSARTLMRADYHSESILLFLLDKGFECDVWGFNFVNLIKKGWIRALKRIVQVNNVQNFLRHLPHRWASLHVVICEAQRKAEFCDRNAANLGVILPTSEFADIDYPEMMRFLLQSGVDKSIRNEEDNLTPLELAQRFGLRDLIPVLSD